MATIFQSFRSSTLSKRLLIYALQRMELLDEETLDMENLQFAIGRTTTAEFKDVGVRLKKLERLLQLPASFQIQKAKVLKLTVTVPVDFYTSPIVIEIDGVDVRLKVAAGEDNKGKAKAASAGEDDKLPNTINLAQSFLNEDAALKDASLAEEKRRLEDALAAETQDLSSSSISMSDSSVSDDDSQFGTGQPLSLPGFLAGFLQGIVDRIQVRIRGVTFQMDVEVPVEPSATTPELVTFQLALDRIDVEGVTTDVQNPGDAPAIVPKEGKRHIALSKIRAYLISEANVFSQFAPSPSVLSPAVSQSPSFSERNPPSRQGSFRPSSMHGSYLSDSVGLSDVDDGLLQDSEEAFNIPYDFSSQTDEPAEEEENTNTPRASIYQDFSPRRVPVSHSTIVDDRDHTSPWASFEREARSEPSLQPTGIPPITFHDAEGLAASQHSSIVSSGSEPAEDEDLAQSHLFTHEEAESMYMSAFSQAESRPAGSRMPGGWDADSSPEASPLPKKTISSPRQPSPTPGDEAAFTERVPQSSNAAAASPPTVAASPERVDTTVENRSEPHESPKKASFDEGAADATAQADDVATPRGPTRLVKELVSLNNISVYVPSLNQQPHVPADTQASVLGQPPMSPGLARSVGPQVPGAFSVYSTSPGAKAGFAPRSPGPIEQESGEDVEVILSPIEVRFDASLAYLLAVVVGKLVDALKGKETPSPPKTPTAATAQPESAMKDIKVMFEKISLHFLHHLGGVADTAERFLGSAGLQLQPEILLRADLENLGISLKSMKQSLETSIDLEKFRFGYAKDDIVSFDQSLQMRASVMDKFPSAGSDISVKVITSPGTVRTEVTTLPLLVQLDLQRLDETFSWFGGLSSFLNMSSSMSSSASPSVRTPVQPAPKPRGVRFDAPINPDDKSAASENKVDMRIGGFNLELKGKECSVGLETSAVKMVSRELGIGFAISKVRLAGPYIRNSRAEPPISAEVGGVRFEYLATPKDKDLERLLELIIPSKVKFDQGDDEIMVDTLLRQRRKGGVLRVTLDQLNVRVENMQQLSVLPALGEEVARLATVAKYLPEDDRPGLLLLAEVKELGAVVDIGGKIGTINANCKGFEVAQITVPSLVAFGMHTISVNRNHREELVSSSTTLPPGTLTYGPVLMVRMIGDEMEPVIKIKMRDVTVDYRVSTIMDVLGLGEDATPQDFEASLAASVANLGEQAHTALAGKKPQSARLPDPARPNSKPMTVDLVLRDCLIGLNPLGLPSKLLIALTDARLQVVLPKDVDTTAKLDLNKASILLIDDVANIGANASVNRRQSADMSSQQVSRLVSQGFVSICYISSAKAIVKVTESRHDGEKHVDVELRDDLLVLETCADSTQTLITLANALKPPTPPSKENKYRTNIVPVQDLLASISADAFGRAEGNYDFDRDFELAQELGGDDEYDMASESDDSGLHVNSHYFSNAGPSVPLFDAEASVASHATSGHGARDALTDFNASGSAHVSDDGSDLLIHDTFFNQAEDAAGKAKIWNSTKNTYDRAPKELIARSPLRVSIRDVHVIWNLFDGYDWERTRNVISKAVQDVEEKAYERRRRSARVTYEDEEEEDETVIGDFLFNSIYIGISSKQDPRDLAQMVNQELNDNATETESLATTAFTTTTGRGGAHRPKKKLRLNRSKHHKITFELQGVNIDLLAFPPDSGETQSSIDVRVQNLDVFDHVPTSTWKKFATYDQDAGEREMGTSMAHIELLNIKPHPDLAASEMVVRVTLLPLRLHVDQDALDFITRFFEFKDDTAPVHSSASDIPFLQRVEVHDIPVKLDFKPKRVDYAGLKSGRTTEFMNFIILDEARLTLRHTIIYGVSGFDRMGKILNDIWMPDVKGTQLAGVLAGLAPVRGIVNIGSGFKELIEVPIKEYKKDGRIVRSIGKGAAAFVKTTGTEMVKFGAKLAIGTQYALQGAENLLNKPQADNTWEDADLDPEDKKQISLYADQPTGVIQGMRGGYSSLARDLNLARDAIIAVPGEVMDSQSAQGLAKAVLKRAPTIIFRPAIGATKAIGQTLMGATNSLDPQNRRRAEEKYKRH